MDLKDFVNIALIILSAALITAILLQSRGGGLGAVMGGEGIGQYKTRRGLEKTLFQITIGLSLAFFVLVVVTLIIGG